MSVTTVSTSSTTPGVDELVDLLSVDLLDLEVSEVKQYDLPSAGPISITCGGPGPGGPQLSAACIQTWAKPLDAAN